MGQNPMFFQKFDLRAFFSCSDLQNSSISDLVCPLVALTPTWIFSALYPAVPGFTQLYLAAMHPDPGRANLRSNFFCEVFFGTMMILRGSGGPRFTSGGHLRGSFQAQRGSSFVFGFLSSNLDQTTTFSLCA